MIIKVGCCGWAVKGGRKAYFKKFKLIELQDTFYNLPRVELAVKWRNMAPEDFEYTLKAWQLITHPHTSPTWRRLKIKIPEEEKKYYGFLKPTEQNIKAWEKTLEICKALKARICVLQTPPSFKPTKQNIDNMETFLTTIKRDNILIAWEPRGEWLRRMDLIAEICRKLDLLHVTDILKRKPAIVQEILYTRLHGLGAEINYRYKYKDEDLQRLKEVILSFKNEVEEAYVLFNNIYMAEDALRFMKIIAEGT